MKRKSWAIFILITAIAILGLTACGRGSRNENIGQQCEETGLTIRSLTIRTSDMHTWVIRQAADAMNIAWQAQGKPYVFHVEIEEYSWLDWFIVPDIANDRQVRTRLELMAGHGPDIFILDENYELHSLINSGLFQNIYDLMDADPTTDRSDFFTQVLEAFEVNSGLYIFPVSFMFEYVAVNAELPEEFINRFAQKSTISYMEMIDFYLDLIHAHADDFGHFSFDTLFGRVRPSTLVLTAINEFTDFNARTANLTDLRFIEILERIKAVHADTPYWGVSHYQPPMIRRWQEAAHERVFLSGAINLVDGIFTTDPPIVKHPVPLTDNFGRLLLNEHSTWACVAITAAGNGALAWEFTQHLIYAYTNPVGMARLHNPQRHLTSMWSRDEVLIPRISRRLFHDYTLVRAQAIIDYDDNENRSHQNSYLINRTIANNELPMHTQLLWIPFRLIEEPLDQFRRDVIDARTAAQQMYNAVTLWLIE